MCRDLYREEVALKENLDKEARKLLTPHRIYFKSISKEEEIIDSLIYLFRRRKGIT